MKIPKDLELEMVEMEEWQKEKTINLCNGKLQPFGTGDILTEKGLDFFCGIFKGEHEAIYLHLYHVPKKEAEKMGWDTERYFYKYKEIIK